MFYLCVINGLKLEEKYKYMNYYNEIKQELINNEIN